MRAAAVFGLGTSPAELNPFRAGSTTEWVEGVPASADDADAVLIFGGDGTIHRHLPALVRLGLPVLVVPAGSGNDFARALKLRSSRDSLRAWRGFESGQGHVQAIDLGVIVAAAAPERPHYFCCVAGCGLDSIAARRANRMPRWLRARGGYALALLPILLHPPAPLIRLTQFLAETRQEAAKPTLLVAFANTQFYGDGMRVAPRADFADGKLDICRIGPMNSLKLLGMFPSVYSGRHLSMSGVEYTQAERACVETDAPLEIYADGEFVCETPAEIRVEPKAIRVITAPTQR